LIEATEKYANFSFVAGVANEYGGAESQPKLVLEGARVGILGGRALFDGALGFSGVFAETFDVAHGQTFGNDLGGDRVRIMNGKKSAGVAGRYGARRKQLFCVLGKIEKAQRIGDMASALADDAGDIRMGVTVVFAKLLISPGFFECGKVCALDVFDNGDFEGFAIADVENQDWDLMQVGALCRAPSTFAGDNLEGVGDPGYSTNEDGLNYPSFAN
jgi:hypothetical protein